MKLFKCKTREMFNLSLDAFVHQAPDEDEGIVLDEYEYILQDGGMDYTEHFNEKDIVVLTVGDMTYNYSVVKVYDYKMVLYLI